VCAAVSCIRPTAENLVPIRIDIEVEGKRLKDAFLWHADGKFDGDIDQFAASQLGYSVVSSFCCLMFNER
jgi:hypothetical protein